MFSIRVVGVALAGGLLLGCHSGNVSGPNASTSVPTDQQAAAGLLRSWESTHPGSHAGVIDAVLPARRLASIADLPVNEIPEGTVVTILDDRRQTLVSGVVVARKGSDVHIRYEPLAGGERDPRVGDLAVWFPGGEMVAPETMQPGTTQPAGAPPENMPATNPPAGTNPPPPPPAAPATQPSDNATPPATQPTGTTGAAAATPDNASNTTGTTGNTGATTGNTGATTGNQQPEVNK